jgi:hypothetical protein
VLVAAASSPLAATDRAAVMGAIPVLSTGSVEQHGPHQEFATWAVAAGERRSVRQWAPRRPLPLAAALLRKTTQHSGPRPAAAGGEMGNPAAVAVPAGG